MGEAVQGYCGIYAFLIRVNGNLYVIFFFTSLFVTLAKQQYVKRILWLSRKVNGRKHGALHIGLKSCLSEYSGMLYSTQLVLYVIYIS